LVWCCDQWKGTWQQAVRVRFRQARVGQKEGGYVAGAKTEKILELRKFGGVKMKEGQNENK